MPHRQPPSADNAPQRSAPQRAPANFRRRYDDLELHRTKLIERLTALGDAARQQAGYRHALKLLNDTFRKSSLAQRFAVLQAAAWLINVLEKIASSL